MTCICINIWQSFVKDLRILIVLKTWKIRQSSARQSLACQFFDCIFSNFFGPKIYIHKLFILKKDFYEIG